MEGIDDINVNFDTDDKKISIADNILGDSNLDVKNDDDMFGVDLLANRNYGSGNSDNGYSSGEEQSSRKKEDYDFFKEKEEKEKEASQRAQQSDERSEETRSIPLDDPIINDTKGFENGGFKPLGAMNAQEIKNEKNRMTTE